MEKTVGVRLDADLYRRLEKAADQQEMTRSALVRRAILAECIDYEGTNGRKAARGTKKSGGRSRRNARGGS